MKEFFSRFRDSLAARTCLWTLFLLLAGVGTAFAQPTVGGTVTDEQPYGEYNDTVVSTINGLGMHVIQWDVDSLDWKGLSSDEITSRVLTRVQPGSIVLFHNAAEHTPEALAGIIEALIADGYSIIPISQRILPGDTSIDPNGRQCPATVGEGS